METVADRHHQKQTRCQCLENAKFFFGMQLVESHQPVPPAGVHAAGQSVSWNTHGSATNYRRWPAACRATS